jgi:hypothetical protein
MSEVTWKKLLSQWSLEIISSSEYLDELPAEVTESRWLGFPGANQEQIKAAETRLGVNLPPSYRAFLKVTNGWRRTTSFIHKLLPVEEIDWYTNRQPEAIDAWMQWSDESISDEEYLVYGERVAQPFRARYLQTALAVSAYGDGIYLLNPKTVTTAGEWEAWFFAPWIPGAHRYPSFWELMQAEHEHFLFVLKYSQGLPTPHVDPSLGVAAQDFDGLVAALQRRDPGRRRAALEALGFLRDRRALEPVLKIFQDPAEDLFVREFAARTLGKLRDPRAARPLIDALRTRSEPINNETQLSALMGKLEGLPDISLGDLMSFTDQLLGQAAGDHLRAALSPTAIEHGFSDHLNYAIKQGLLELGECALPALRAAQNDADPQVRLEVAAILEYWGKQNG